MNLAELRSITAKKVDEDLGSYTRYISNAVIDRALSRAQSVYCFLTLCYEVTATIAFTVNQPSLTILGTLPLFIAPLRLSQFGRTLQYKSIHQFAARNNSWTGESGIPEAYALVASNLMAIFPCPSSSAVTAVDISYASLPPALFYDGDIPVIPAEDHEVLTMGAGAILRSIILGGQHEAEAALDVEGFWLAVQRRAAFIAERNRWARYDTLPVGISKLAIKQLLKDVAQKT